MPKRKSDVVDLISSEDDVPGSKKARVSDASASSSKTAPTNKPIMTKKELKEMEKFAGREAELSALEEDIKLVSLISSLSPVGPLTREDGDFTRFIGPSERLVSILACLSLVSGDLDPC